ncbi:MAG: 4-hydroxy-3-methylbut-2-enyl diphosphate reductase [Thermoguttaceae bacterium]
MRIILAGPRGFCAGVNMAVESLETALRRYGTPIYVYHEIVHNRWVVERFRRLGVVFVDDLAEVPAGAHLLYSAHGVSPEVRREAARRGLDTIDATCPLVTKVHREAVRFAAAGYTVILIGHAGHDEVVGVMGEAPGALVLVQTPEDVERLEVADAEKVVYLTQTTLSLTDAARTTQRLRERFPKIAAPLKGDICYATQNRQEVVRTLSRQADVVLVVGSRNSSNSRRLDEMARQGGRPSHLIDGPADIDPAWFSGDETVLITAGASAPEDIVQECIAGLCKRFDAVVEPCTLFREEIGFLLPLPLRGDSP